MVIDYDRGPNDLEETIDRLEKQKKYLQNTKELTMTCLPLQSQIAMEPPCNGLSACLTALKCSCAMMFCMKTKSS